MKPPTDAIRGDERGGITRVGVDVGGTFTDLVLYRGNGEFLRTKIPTDLAKAGNVIATGLDRLDTSPETLDLFVHGTTVVTNLILERRGARVGLITTRGYRDLLEIGLSYRPRPYDLQWEKQAPLVPRPLRWGVTERMAASGEVVTRLNEDEVRRAAKALERNGCDAIAVVFLHSYVNPSHEEEARRIIGGITPTINVSLSSEVDPQLREFERTTTTVLNAYAAPAMGNYVARLAHEIPTLANRTFYMHSGGGVVPPQRVMVRPIELVSSGPAAGVLAAQFIGRQLEMPDLITFDTGGTSADVCLIEGGQAQERDSTDVSWGVPLRTRCIDVTSVGAGGGSIAWIDGGGTLRIGPGSAGSDPGPACYGRGGEEATVTDANLVLGLLDAGRFLGGRMHLDSDAARRSISRIADALTLSIETAAQGIRRIATANMAQAVHQITVQKGIDPRKFTLVAFGGAGGQHAIEVAAEMGISKVLFPPLPSTFSAFGLLSASLRASEQTAFLRRLDEDISDGEEVFERLVDRARLALGFPDSDSPTTHDRYLQLRYLGQTHELTIPLPALGWPGVSSAFEDAHQRLFGTRLGDSIEIVALGVVVHSPLLEIDPPMARIEPGDPLLGSSEIALTGGVLTYERGRAPVGCEISGPCLIYEDDSTIVVPDGWVGRVGRLGELLFHHARLRPSEEIEGGVHEVGVGGRDDIS